VQHVMLKLHALSPNLSLCTAAKRLISSSKTTLPRMQARRGMRSHTVRYVTASSAAWINQERRLDGESRKRIDKADELPVHNRKGVGNLQNIRKRERKGGGKACGCAAGGQITPVTVAGPLILHFRKLQCAIRNARTRFNRSLLVPYPYLSQKSQMFCFHNKCLN
jgi:hypothetical protein